MKNYGANDSGFSDLSLSAFLVGVSSSERRMLNSLFWSRNLDFIKQVVFMNQVADQYRQGK